MRILNYLLTVKFVLRAGIEKERNNSKQYDRTKIIDVKNGWETSGAQRRKQMIERKNGNCTERTDKRDTHESGEVSNTCGSTTRPHQRIEGRYKAHAFF